MSDYKIFRDMGAEPILPYLRILSTDFIVQVLYPWYNVPEAHRQMVRDELNRRMEFEAEAMS